MNKNLKQPQTNVIDHSSLLSSKNKLILTKQRQIAEQLIDSIFSTKKIVFVTGAGISVSAGIPDFRSSDGLYKLLKEKHDLSSGKEMFSAGLFKDESKRKLFYQFIAEMKLLTSSSMPTFTHKFVSSLLARGKLLRWYTQNIDLLEQKVVQDSQKVVYLHGSLMNVICTLCRNSSLFDTKCIEIFKKGESVACATCEKRNEVRKMNNKRLFPVGFLRPDVILYDEHHHNGDDISDLVEQDLRKNPEMLIIVGTSLNVVGVKQLVKDISKSISSSRENSKSFRTIMINKTDLSQKSDFRNVIDLFWLGSCDEIFSYIEKGLIAREKLKAEKSDTRKKKELRRISEIAEVGQSVLEDWDIKVVKQNRSRARNVKKSDPLYTEDGENNENSTSKPKKISKKSKSNEINI